MAHDNYIESRGYGEWMVTTYNPAKEFGPYSGRLDVSRDFHVIRFQDDNSTTDTHCIASFPSQNVAVAENIKFKNKKK